jgi:hypothetical protein
MGHRIHIPKSFKLNGKEIPVVFDSTYCNGIKAWGEADFDSKVITLNRVSDGKKISKRLVDQTFYHELVHMILDSCQRHNLKWNEEFVEDFAQRLYEFEKTKKL